MASKVLMAISAGTAAVLGLVYLASTFSGSSLLPRNAATLQAAMDQAHLSVTPLTTVWRAWVGFNASHGIALLLFGLVFGFLALQHDKLLFGSHYLLAVGFAVLAAFAVLARVYWFSVPLAGVVLALGCSAGAIFLARGPL